MYHYIKDFKKTDFPYLKGLDIKNFRFQIKFLKSKFKILDPFDIHELFLKKKKMEENYCWLTFDDGHIDHYENVIPILEENKIKASFFAPVKSTKQDTILDVNKIQLILGKSNNFDELLSDIKEIFSNLNSNKKYSSIDYFIKKVDTENRFDNPKTILIKRLLQKDLPKVLRETICDKIFKKYFSNNITEMAKKFYMSLGQLKEIYKMGHEIGLHGYNHEWYTMLSEKEQFEEISDTINFWKKNSLLKNNFTMCYPYGDYNQNTIEILRNLNCSLALTTKVASVPLSGYEKLELPRYDTNDFPKAP